MASRRRSRVTDAVTAVTAARRWIEARIGRDPLPLFALGAAGAVLLVVFGLQSRDSTLLEAEPVMRTAEAPINIEPVPAEGAAPASEPEIVAATADANVDAIAATDPEAAPVVDPAALEPEWHPVQVARGDTLGLIFGRLGLSPALVHRIVNLDAHGKSLTRLRPGDELAFDLDADGAFRAVRAELDDEHWLFIEAGAEDALASRTEPRALETRIVEVEAEISSSLFNAGKNAGLSDNMILRLAGIFGWDIDFALDIRRGDRFAIVFEEIYRDGEFLRQGAILGARFINQGKNHVAIRFDAGNGPDYFDPDGRPMRKAFLRAPLNFTRVTSNFNPRRFHPVTRRVRPHNGTDYGAATGTPVWAAGDGTVIEAGYGAANGNYIFLQHGNHIVTRYLHLSKKHVKRGDRVRQGQTIGLVGATGLASGPHLHYEFLVNGRHRDPRTVDLPVAEPLPGDLLPEFRNASASLLTQLEELLPPRVMLADSRPGSASTTNSRAEAGRSQTAPQ
jgi:murein DD-endopeptidase MepM/ murein hydrolase activator NlpD